MRTLPEFLIDKKGKEVPIHNVRRDHLEKHLIVEKAFTKADKLQTQMLKLKASINKEIEKYAVLAARIAGEKDFAFENITLTNYPGTLQLEINSQSVVEFDDNIQLAKKKIDECLKNWSEGAHANLRVLIDGVFKVDKKGKLSKERIFSLFAYKMDDPAWDEAMNLIKESVTVNEKKKYLTLKSRLSTDHKWKLVNLNFSSLEGDE